MIFDLFGTLIDNFSRREYDRVLTAMAEALGVPSEDFTSAWQATFDLRAVGDLASVEANITHCLRTLGKESDPSCIAAAVRIRMALTERALIPRQESESTLLALRASGFRLGLISDCSSEVPLVWPHTVFAPLFDTALFSCAVGLKKPDPRIYRLACNRLGVPARRCLYVGDGSRELTGAAAVGMTAIMLQASHEDPRDAHRIDAEAWAGPTVTALPEVLGLVEAGC